MADSKLTALTALTDPQLTDLLYMVDDPSGTPVSKKATVQDVLALSLWAPPEGMRLSASTNTYVTTSDVTAAGTIYWTPVISGGHGTVTGYNGTVIASKSVTQKSLALTVTSGKNYDVFYDYDGDVLALSAAWTTDTARADALADEQGAIVLGSDHTKLWLGTICASGTNTIEDSATKRFVWNTYNQTARNFSKSDSSTTWTYTVDTVWRQTRADATNQVEFVTGAAGSSMLSLVAMNEGYPATTDYNCAAAIGLDSTSTPHTDCLRTYQTTTSGGLAVIGNYAVLTTLAPLGYHYAAWLEIQNDPTSTTFYGSTAGTFVQPGITGQINA